MSDIEFGTSGWTGIIAEDFTFTGVRAVSQAVGEWLLSADPRAGERGVVIGYDTRFLSEAFAAQVARVLSAQRIQVFLCDRDTPTPVVVSEMLRRQAAGGVIVTAGQASPECNGIRLVGSWGGVAPAGVTGVIEERANRLLQQGFRIPEFTMGEAKARGLIEHIDPREVYLERVRGLVSLEAIRDARLKVVVDPLHGSSQGYLDALLKEAECDVSVLHGWRDPHFGGCPPEPSEDRLRDLAFQVVETSAHLGLATDGDAGRFGLIDADGTYLEPNYFLGLLLRHLVKTRGWTGAAARSVATSHLLDAVARHLGLPLYETSCDFQEIGRLIVRDTIVLGGEESATLSIKGHIPDTDGILACLLAAELVASRGGARLRALLQELYAEVGTFVTKRLTLPLDSAGPGHLSERLSQPPGRLAGLAVIAVKRQDGLKILLEDGSWLLLRLVGREPEVRLYAEAETVEQLDRLLTAGEALIGR